MKTKDIILQKTFGLLLQKGYTGVSISDIQQATGMARGLLYHYFANQELLFEETIRFFLDKWWTMDKESLRNSTITDYIVYAVDKYRKVTEEMQKQYESCVTLRAVCLLFAQVGRLCPTIGEYLRLINNQRETIWKMVVLNSFARGELKTGLNLETLTRHFIYIEEGVIFASSTPEKEQEMVYRMEKAFQEFYEMINSTGR